MFSKVKNMDDDLKEKAIKEAFDYLSGVNKAAYLDTFLLSNQVLSKNPFTNNFLRKFLLKEEVKAYPLFKVILNLLCYYLNSLRFFIYYLISCSFRFILPYKFPFSKDSKEVVIIDAFFLVDQIENSQKYKEPYFPGLEDYFKKNRIDYAYNPIFYWLKNPLTCFNVLKKMGKQGMPLLTEFHCLTLIDLLGLGHFLICYPFHVLSFANRLGKESYPDKLLKYELFDTLNQVTFHSYSRYLQGRRLSRLPFEKIKVISWYENQVLTKNFYKGLRQAGRKVSIYGAQLFIYSKSNINIIPDANESAFGIVPDKIVENGQEFIPKETSLNFAVGPSLRYSRIFNHKLQRAGQDKVVILLSYSLEDAENTLRLVFESGIKRDFLLKMHPGLKNIKVDYLPAEKFKFTKDDVYTLFNSARIVVSSASGTLLEAASLGVPVISVKNSLRFDCNPLPQYGKGVIWEDVVSPDELEAKISLLENNLKNNLQEIDKIAGEYRKMFFTEINDSTIKEAFDF